MHNLYFNHIILYTYVMLLYNLFMMWCIELANLLFLVKNSHIQIVLDIFKHTQKWAFASIEI